MKSRNIYQMARQREAEKKKSPTHYGVISLKIILTLKLALQAECIFPPGVSALNTTFLTTGCPLVPARIP
jgi:hypothetical protein